MSELLNALRLGQAACLTMITFEPIGPGRLKWQTAAKLIAAEVARLEKEKANGE